MKETRHTEEQIAFALKQAETGTAVVQEESRSAVLQQGEVSLARAQQASNAAYKGGVVSLIEVLDADRQLLKTRDGAVQARAAASRGAVTSFRALVGSWSPPRSVIQ